MNTKTIILNHKPLTYVLNRRRRASVRIAVDGRGICSVQAPKSCSLAMVESVLIQNINWIEQKVRNWNAETMLALQNQDYRAKKESARKMISRVVDDYAKKYGFNPQRIAIKRQSSLWGSCSSRGNLNFHYRVAELPERSRDYIVVHELCHLIELNHSPKFWRLVGEIIPDYRLRMKELRNLSKTSHYVLD